METSKAATTTWHYHAQRGWLSDKKYNDNKGTTYTYTPAGRLQTRTWQRGLVTTTTYNTAGEVATVTYSGTTPSTPAIAYLYDRRGRAVTITQNGITTTRAYNNAGQLTAESYSGGILSGLSVNNQYDLYLRRTNNYTTGINAGYSYDSAGRLLDVAEGNNTVTYHYLSNSRLVSSMDFKHNSSTPMTTTKQYDYLNRLTSIDSGSGIASFAYTYNSANQRTKSVLADGSYWNYQYDQLGQVTNGVKYFSDNTPVSGEQFGYGFDDIGNRLATATGGDQSGGGLRNAVYTPNLLNEYTQRTVPNKFDILGSAASASVVTVNSQVGYRKGTFFRNEVTVDNSEGAVWQSITNKGSLTTGSSTKVVTSNQGSVFVPLTPEVFSYDDDGNLTGDGRWTYTWNAENQLVSMVSLTTAPSASKRKLDFLYDYMGRRIQKIVSTYVGSAYVTQSTTRFLYDGWNLIAELNGSNAVIRNYLWGTDLSGTWQGAGGVGGLLAVKDSSDSHFAAFDGNGNVATLVRASSGLNSATYEYGPFGELLRASASITNPIRFSSKYQDEESDLVYYGFRYYNQSAGRWISRDPIKERGGLNLYSLVSNNPVGLTDFLGFGRNDPAPPKSCESCCACPDSIDIYNVTTINGPIPGVPGGPWWGHGFDVVICLSYFKASSAGSLAGPPNLQWFEKSSRTVSSGVVPNTQNDMFVLVPGNQQANQWNDRKEPCPGRKCFTVHDTPAILQTSKFMMPQHLEFSIIVKGSCSTCPLPKTVHAVQDLTLNGVGGPGIGTFKVGEP